MDWVIAGISGLFIGGFFGFFGMALLSGRAYEKGKSDALNAAANVYNEGYDHGYDDGEKSGYREALRDSGVVAKIASTVILDSTDNRQNEGD